MFKSAYSLCLLLPLLIAAHDSRAQSAAILIAKKSLWKYEASGTDLGAAWKEAGFADGNWPSGNGILGFGESYINTPLPAGHTTYYFRQTFSLADDPSTFSYLTLLANYDDGFVIYLNGQEVARRSLPSGTIVYGTSATSHEGGTYETIDLTAHLNKLVIGTNVLAVEVHQLDVASSDVVMDVELNTQPNSGGTVTVVRGPYLQIGTPNSVVVRWRTNIAANSQVRYGTNPANLSSSVENLTLTTEHAVLLANLSPATKYYYSVGTTNAALAGGADFYFVVNPPAGAVKKTRLWILGDAGYGNAAQQRIRDAYRQFAGATHTDMFVLLGDNAYSTGRDEEYQTAVFDMHPITLRQSVLWPVFGNHDAGSASSPTQSGVFYDIFTLPANGEAGGVASGTEAYYSFEYANIHFICLNSHDISRAPDGAMLTWLQQDLAANTRPWTIAFWHHPPYSKGSHDSDTDGQMTEMRQNAVPILENAGVDLVLSGHSHSYERSFLLDGHYGQSITLITDNILNGGSGRADGDGAYTKASYAPASHQGAVYVVAGSGAITSGGPLNHPAMYQSLNVLGSVVLDVDSNRVDVKFLDDLGGIRDYFTLIKGVQPHNPPAAPSNLVAASVGNSRIDLTWDDHSNDESGFKIERKIGVDGSYEEIATVGANMTGYSNTGLAAGTTYFYRVRANNNDGNSAYSNEASATTLNSVLILIAKNSTWKYEASGSEPGTAWKEASFADGNWPSGNGIGGFGESYINTPLPAGYLTYYFRHTFTLADDPSAFSRLTLLTNYDDGFVAYLNGQEVARRSLPVGPITYGTTAISHEGGAYETIDLTAHLSKLVVGTNVLAVEVHQHHIESSDVVMDVELNNNPTSSASTLIARNSPWKYEAGGSDLGAAWKEVSFADGNWPGGNGILGFGESYINTPLPAGYSTYYFRHTFTLADDPSAFAQLTLLANYDDGFVAYLNGQEVARRSLPAGPINYSTIATFHEGGVYETIDLTAHIDKLVAGANVLAVEVHQSNTASSDVVMDMELDSQPKSSVSTLIAKNSNWKYEANGSDPGAAWQQASFADGNWPGGNGILGFGESYINTPLPAGYSTYYFRHTFTVADNPSTFSQLTLLANYDDGFVAYLNGYEVARRSLPAGPISHGTTADLHEGGIYEAIDLTPHLDKLVLGTNVFAVEAHQYNTASSDLVMDMELNGQPAAAANEKRMARLSFAEKDLTIIPDRLELHQNYPNPFNPGTVISFGLPDDAYVTLKVYNVIGEEVETLVEGWRQAGTHSVAFAPKNLANGIYFYVMRTGQERLIRKCSFTK